VWSIREPTEEMVVDCGSSELPMEEEEELENDELKLPKLVEGRNSDEVEEEVDRNEIDAVVDLVAVVLSPDEEEEDKESNDHRLKERNDDLNGGSVSHARVHSMKVKDLLVVPLTRVGRQRVGLAPSSNSVDVNSLNCCCCCCLEGCENHDDY